MNNCFFKIIRYTGLPLFFRELVQRHKVTILMFHDLSPEKATDAFSYLKKHYHLISLKDYLNAVQSGHHLPKKAAVITIDDGHAGNYLLLPTIKKLQIPVSIFLCSGIVGTRRHFWFNHCEELYPERERLKRLPNHLRLEELKSYGFEQTREYADQQALSREQIEEMRPWVDFQAHTCFHPILSQCDDNTAQEEIALSKLHLERDFSLQINAFSYPNGDYMLRDIQFVKDAGFLCGITVDPGYNDLHTDLFRLKRLSVNEARTMDEFIVKVSGCYALMKKYLRR